MILVGDCIAMMKTLPAQSVHCCVTSPPYWGLRCYGVEPSAWGGDPNCKHDWQSRRYYVEGGGGAGSSGEAFSEAGPANAERIKKARWREDATCKCGAWLGCFGLEPSPEMFAANMVQIFREVWRVLRDDGTCWLNLGDTYNAYNGNRGATHGANKGHLDIMPRLPQGAGLTVPTLKPKDLVGIPWRVAFALQADGWYLRGDHVWAKPNGMPESVTDRPTRGHEYVFMLTKSARYWYDSEAVRTAPKASTATRLSQDVENQNGSARANGGAKTNGTMKAVRKSASDEQMAEGANLRSVWWIPPAQCKDAHFAVMPERVAEICILAGTADRGCCPECGASWNRIVESERVRTRPGKDSKVNGTESLEHGNRDTGRHIRVVAGSAWQPGCDHGLDPVPCTVLDCFGGAGTTGLVAAKLGRNYILTELNPEYAAMAEARIRNRNATGPVIEPLPGQMELFL